MNKKYIEQMNKNPVLVMPDHNVRHLDMMPRVNILEDIQFRKAIPKSFKLFEKLAPFSEKLGRIPDGKHFMSAISKDMLKTVLSHFLNT